MEVIYYVEDDESIRSLVVYALNNSGFEAWGFEKWDELKANLKKKKPALIILDIMLEDKDGLKILSELRANREYQDVPVIMLSAKSSEIDKVKGLDLGADDYITKPFGVMELISRVRAVLRRFNKNDSTDNCIKINNVEINYEKREVKVNEKVCVLTFKEFELLYYLAVNKNIVVSREKLLEKIWGYDYEGESRTVDMHIKTLRQKISECGGDDMIKTVRSVGYKIEELQE